MKTTLKRKALSLFLVVTLAVTVIPAEGLTSKAYAADPVIAMGSTQTGVLEPESSKYYQFTIPSSGKVAISGLMEKSDEKSGTAYLRFSVYQNDGKRVYSSERYNLSSIGRKYIDSTAYLNKGTYTIEAEAPFDFGGPGTKYSFSLGFTSVNESFTETNAGTNNTFDTANTIKTNTTYRGMIADNEESDIYRFTIPSKGNMRAILSAVEGTCLKEVNIYDGNRVRQRHWRYPEFIDGEVVEFSPGTYYIELVGASSPFVYSLQIASPIPMSATSIKLSNSSYTYDGYAKTPGVTVAHNGSNLSTFRSYSVSYSANKNAGIGKVTVTGKGAYAGSVTKTFKIKPSRPSVKAVKGVKKGFKATWAKKSKAEATGYQVQYSTKKSMKGAKTKTVKGGAKTVKGLKAGKRYYVRVRAYKTVGKQKVYSSWSAKRAVTTKRR